MTIIPCDFDLSSFTWTKYEKLLNEAVPIDSSTISEEKVEKIFNNFISTAIKIECTSPDEYQCISKIVKKLINLKEGRRFVKILINSGVNISIKLASGGGESKYVHVNKEIQISKSHRNCVLYKDGKILFKKISKSITLAHELIHALHYSLGKNSELFEEEKHSYKLISKDLTNPEEQDTILGLSEDEQGNLVFNPLCENGFLRSLDMGIRMSHMSSEPSFPLELLDDSEWLSTHATSDFLAEQQTFYGKKMTLLEAAYRYKKWDAFDFLLRRCASCNFDEDYYKGIFAYAFTNHRDFKTILKLLDCAPSLLNQTYEIGGRKNTVLSYALLSGEQEVFNALLNRGADIHLVDVHGGALHVALAKRNPEAIQQLVERGARLQPGYYGLQNFLEDFGYIDQATCKLVILPILKLVPWGDTINASLPIVKNLIYCPIEILETLVDMGADLSAKDSRGDTLLIHFLRQLERLVKESCHLRVEDLHTLPEFRKKFDLLINTRGMDLTASSSGQTAYDIAKRLGNQTFIQALQPESVPCSPSLPAPNQRLIDLERINSHPGVHYHASLFFGDASLFEAAEGQLQQIHNFSERIESRSVSRLQFDRSIENIQDSVTFYRARIQGIRDNPDELFETFDRTVEQVTLGLTDSEFEQDPRYRRNIDLFESFVDAIEDSIPRLKTLYAKQRWFSSCQIL